MINKIKKIVLFSKFILFFIVSNAQNLTLGELSKIRMMSFEEANLFLGNKNWKFISVEENWGKKTITWAFEKNNEKAKAWLGITYDMFESNSLYYQITSIKTINNIKIKLKELGFKVKSSNYLNNKIETIYSNNKYTLKLESSPENSEEPSVYYIELTKNPRKPTLSEIKKADEKRRLDSIEGGSKDFCVSY